MDTSARAPLHASPDDALAQLETRLRKAGFDAARPDVAIAWKVFREFGALPVEVHDDSFIFECGVYDDREGTPRFMWSLKRQFAHEPYEGRQIVEHLQLNCYFALESGDAARDTVESSYDHASLAAFWTHLESLATFQQGLRRGVPVGFELFQEEV